MVQDFLSFLRPVSPLKDTPPRTRTRRAMTDLGERPMSVHSFATACVPPLAIKKHDFRASFGNLRPRAATYTQPEPYKPSRRTPISRLAQCDGYWHETTNRDNLVKRDYPPPIEVVQTDESEAENIERIRKQALSRKSGHWMKIKRVVLTKREKISFDKLRAQSTDPVRKADVLAACTSLDKHTTAAGGQIDKGHRPLKMLEARHGTGAPNELWEEDPFSGNVYSVYWAPSSAGRPMTAANEEIKAGLGGRRRASTLETVSLVDDDPISTIRLVHDPTKTHLRTVSLF